MNWFHSIYKIINIWWCIKFQDARVYSLFWITITKEIWITEICVVSLIGKTGTGLELDGFAPTNVSQPKIEDRHFAEFQGLKSFPAAYFRVSTYYEWLKDLLSCILKIKTSIILDGEIDKFWYSNRYNFQTFNILF